jgi:hypothetical protein
MLWNKISHEKSTHLPNINNKVDLPIRFRDPNFLKYEQAFIQNKKMLNS